MQRVLSQSEVCELIGRSRVWVYRHARNGTFPAPRMAGSRLFWLAEEVEEWLRTAPVPTWAARKKA